MKVITWFTVACHSAWKTVWGCIS